MADSFIISKAGYYLLDENDELILDSSGKPLTFKEKESAENHLKENNLVGTVK